MRKKMQVNVSNLRKVYENKTIVVARPTNLALAICGLVNRAFTIAEDDSTDRDDGL